ACVPVRRLWARWMAWPERLSSRRTPWDLGEMPLSSSLVSLPAPGISRSIRYCGIAPPFLVGSAEGREVAPTWPDAPTCRFRITLLSVFYLTELAACPGARAPRRQ